MTNRLVFLFTCLGLVSSFELPSDDPGPSVNVEDLPDSCHLPTGIPAFCVGLSRCTQVKALVSNLQKPLPGDVALLIKDSFFCGRNDKEALVCCPSEAIVDPSIPADPPIQQRGKSVKNKKCDIEKKNIDAQIHAACKRKATRRVALPIEIARLSFNF